MSASLWDAAAETNALAERFYECHTAARRILGDDFDATIDPFRAAIVMHAWRERQSVMQAVVDLGQRLYVDADGVGLVLLAAAAVELIASEVPT
jgi:hypothetical protein